MTKDEAINHLLTHSTTNGSGMTTDKQHEEAKRIAIEALEQRMWIPVHDKLPEEKINPITEDFYEYQCTVKFGDFYDVRSYKFGRGHWWNYEELMDRYVIAWMPLPEPYKAQESEDKE